MVRPGARRAAVFLVSAVLATVLAVPLVGPAGAETPLPACPRQGGTQQHMAESLTVRVAVDGVSVDGLWGNVTPDSTVEVSVVVPPGCPAVQLTLASYHSPVAGFSVDQWLADHQTRTIAGTGTRESFRVEVPDCYFQVDFAYGEVIRDFRQGMYGPRLIASGVGGSRTCEQLPPPQPAPSTTPSESVTVTPSDGATPSESVTATPSESVTVTPSDSATPSRSAPAPAPPATSGVLGVSTTPPTSAAAPASAPRVVAAKDPSPQASTVPAASVRVAGDTRVARLADTGIPGSLLALVALLFGTAGVLLLVSARLRGGRPRDRD